MRKKVLGRVYAVPPQDLDRFYMRMLLMNTPNVHGFEGENGLRLSKDESWRAAAERRGLVDNDAEFQQALADAALIHDPAYLRQIFVLLLIHCEVAEPTALWETQKEELSADHMQRALDSAEAFDAA